MTCESSSAKVLREITCQMWVHYSLKCLGGDNLPHSSVTGSYTSIHKHECTYTKTHIRNLPLWRRKVYFLSRHLSSPPKWKGKNVVSVACRAHWQWFPSSAASKAAYRLSYKLMQQNHCLSTESLLAQHGPSKAPWHELMKMKGKVFCTSWSSLISFV